MSVEWTLAKPEDLVKHIPDAQIKDGKIIGDDRVMGKILQATGGHKADDPPPTTRSTRRGARPESPKAHAAAGGL